MSKEHLIKGSILKKNLKYYVLRVWHGDIRKKEQKGVILGTLKNTKTQHSSFFL